MDALTEREMHRAKEMHDFLASRLAGKYPHDDRRGLLAIFMSVAQSHHEAILLLAGQERLVSSAFALFRPMVEAAYRGLFVAFLAKDEQIETIKAGGEPYGRFNKLANDLDDKFQTDGMYSQYGRRMEDSEWLHPTAASNNSHGASMRKECSGITSTRRKSRAFSQALHRFSREPLSHFLD